MLCSRGWTGGGKARHTNTRVRTAAAGKVHQRGVYTGRGGEGAKRGEGICGVGDVAVVCAWALSQRSSSYRHVESTSASTLTHNRTAQQHTCSLAGFAMDLRSPS